MKSTISGLHRRSFLNLDFTNIRRPRPLRKVTNFRFLNNSHFLHRLKRRLLRSILNNLISLRGIQMRLLTRRRLIMRSKAIFLRMNFPRPTMLTRKFLQLLTRLRIKGRVISILSVNRKVIRLIYSFLN